MAGIIKTLKGLFNKQTIYPQTVVKAVFDDNGKRLDNILAEDVFDRFNTLEKKTTSGELFPITTDNPDVILDAEYSYACVINGWCHVQMRLRVTEPDTEYFIGNVLPHTYWAHHYEKYMYYQNSYIGHTGNIFSWEIRFGKSDGNVRVVTNVANQWIFAVFDYPVNIN